MQIRKSTKFLIIGVILALGGLFIIDDTKNENLSFDTSVILLSLAFISLGFLFYSIYLTIPEVIKAVQNLRKKHATDI